MTDALSAAIAGEDAAIYAYGVIGPRLTGAALILAQQAEVAHRDARDQFIATMPSPPAPEVVYALPFPVTDAAAALALAITIEERCTALWRAAVAEAAPSARTTPLTVMIATATRATAFRRQAGAFPGTVTFPGL